MDHWQISYQLNSDSYHPLEYGGFMSSSIHNKTTHKMLVIKAGLSFDWKGTGKGIFWKNANTEIPPGATVSLPEIPLRLA